METVIAYHGTAQTFDKFDEAFIGSNFGVDAQGFFFTSSLEEAEYIAQYESKGDAPHVKTAALDLQNPLILTVADVAWRSYVSESQKTAPNILDAQDDGYIDAAIECGHDGVIAVGIDGVRNYVVFSAEQIEIINV